jgi:hypothetical protein
MAISLAAVLHPLAIKSPFFSFAAPIRFTVGPNCVSLKLVAAHPGYLHDSRAD